MTAPKEYAGAEVRGADQLQFHGAWPKLFHRIWLDEEESPRFAEFRERLEELHPSWRIVTWNDSSKLAWLRNRDLFLESMEKDPFGRAPDILRYELLWRFGGVYIDTDFEPLRAFDDLLDDERPFAAWENDRTMCTALLASPPGHPAIDELIEELPANYLKFAHKTPNYATGPEFATRLWRPRDDVRRMPPVTFYPVGWWEKHLLGGPYPEETYAVHHWAKGWGDDKEKVGSAVVLVPLRSGDPDRDRAWGIARPRLEAMGIRVVAADSPGDFNRAAAINEAARKAGPWDVAVICDADTVDDPKAVMHAIEMVREDGGAVVPWNVRWKLSKAGVMAYQRGGVTRPTSTMLDRADRTRQNLAREWRGGTVVVSREAWEAVGGFDEGFASWGNEDVAFRVAVETLAGPLRDVKAVSWHLWHPRTATTPGQKAKDRLAVYHAAQGQPSEMAASIKELQSGAAPLSMVRTPPTKVLAAQEKAGRREPAEPVDAGRVTLLVPFRSELDDDYRDRVWEWMRKRWEATLPGAEIAVGQDGGVVPFSKTTAVNDAFMRSEKRDVLVILDADAWMDPDFVLRAGGEALREGRLVVPWKKVVRLNRHDTDLMLAGPATAEFNLAPEVRRRAYASPSTRTAATLVVLARESFEALNGMDPRFRGWGYEDVCFGTACARVFGNARHLPGDCVSLYHPRPNVGGTRYWEGEDLKGPWREQSAELNRLYRTAGSREAMLELCAQHPLGGSDQPVQRRPPRDIIRI